MSDKQKQIEEIYRLIDNNCALINNCIECQFGKQDNFDCDKLCVATALYNAGYRKIPENAVVLTREEYEKLKKFEYRVQSGVCMTQKEWFDFCNEDSNRRTCLRIEEREKERKETAEKFAEKLFEVFDEYFLYDIAFINRKINEICKEITDKEVQNGN